ncbi:MAG: hypothetical protein XE01_1444, partial [Synergistales bacterium 58_81]
IHSRTNMIAPAVVNLSPSIMKGGRVSIANFMARYVVPQKK